MKKGPLISVLIAALAVLSPGCGGSKQLRTLQTQRYIGSVPLGTDLAAVARELGAASSKASYDIGPRRIAILFYRTAVNSSSLGVVYSSKYTPLLFEDGRLIAVGWELDKPEFSREATGKVLTQLSGKPSPGQVLEQDLKPDTQEHKAP